MSGIASAASTIPGSVATFWSCSSERSCAIAASSSSSAKTRAGTRMSPRDSAGISQSVSSMRLRSDIEHDLRPPDGAVVGEFEVMVRHCFHEVGGTATVAGDDCPETRAVEVESFQALRDEVFGLREEDELLEPRVHLRRREDVRAAPEDKGGVQVALVHALERRVLEIDLDLPWRLVQPERRGSFVGSVAEQRLDGEHVAAAGLAPGDRLDFPQLLERIDADVGIGADADADPALEQSLDR